MEESRLASIVEPEEKKLRMLIEQAEWRKDIKEPPKRRVSIESPYTKRKGAFTVQ